MAGKTILFNVFNFSERGEPICVYNYAKYNEEILGNSSVIVAPYESERFSLERFKNRFPNVFFYKSQEELRHMTQQADLLYLITSGVMNSSIDVGNLACRVGIHCVFTAHHRHGDVYAAISEWVADTYALHDVPVVPHIVILPETNGDLRNELGIPEDAVVFGRYGGYEQFNILSIMQTIAQSLNDRKDIYFLFMNTASFYEHPRIIYLPKTHDMEYKAKFINTSDAMIHCRREGETFGLAVGEFSLRRRPVITWYWSFDRHHINVLGEAGIYYRNPRELYQILMSFQKGERRPDRYSGLYNPQTVMEQFEKVFIG